MYDEPSILEHLLFAEKSRERVLGRTIAFCPLDPHLESKSHFQAPNRHFFDSSSTSACIYDQTRPLHLGFTIRIMTDQSYCPFLGLPTELRLLIYGFALLDGPAITIGTAELKGSHPDIVHRLYVSHLSPDINRDLSHTCEPRTDLLP